MDLKTLNDIPPWDWPEGTGTMLLDILRSDAASEAGLSRIYGGVHTRIDHEAGIKLGHDVARFVLKEDGSSDSGLKNG